MFVREEGRLTHWSGFGRLDSGKASRRGDMKLKLEAETECNQVKTVNCSRNRHDPEESYKVSTLNELLAPRREQPTHI